jgi:hypothetical protein
VYTDLALFRLLTPQEVTEDLVEFQTQLDWRATHPFITSMDGCSIDSWCNAPSIIRRRDSSSGIMTTGVKRR